MGWEVREFDHQLAMEQKEEVRQRIAAEYNLLRMTRYKESLLNTPKPIPL